jgi:regulator of sigma E protease
MSNVADWLWTFFGFVVAISVLVAVHEFGHYWVARRLGFKVVRFSIGFGKPIWKRVAGADRTEYVVASIPLGGYVKLLDEREGPVPMDELPRSFTRRPVWQRLLVLVAGPIFNFLFAIVAYWILFMSGVPETRPIVGEVVMGSPAAQAGLRPGDELISIDDHRTKDSQAALFALLQGVVGDGRFDMRVRSKNGDEHQIVIHIASEKERHRLTEPGILMEGLGFDFDRGPAEILVQNVLAKSPAEKAGLEAGDHITAIDGVHPKDGTAFISHVAQRAGQRVVLDVDRDGRKLRIPVDVRTERSNGAVTGKIGAEIATNPVHKAPMVRLGPVNAIGRAASETWDMSYLTVNLLYNMVAGRVSVKNISGPLNIATFAGATARAGVRQFLGFLAIVSISLGILNLLPIPILDGGQMVFQAIEGVKGSPLSERAQVFGQQIGIALLLLLMSLAFYNDISARLLN